MINYLLILFELGIFNKVPLDQIMIVYSRKPVKGYEVKSVHTSGGKIIVPIFQKAEFVPRFTRTLDIDIKDVVCASMGSTLKMDIDMVAQISNCIDYEGLNNAVEHQLSLSESDVDKMAIRILEHHTRIKAKNLMAWKISRDRDGFIDDVRKSAKKDMWSRDLEIKSLIIKGIDDKEGFIDTLVGFKFDEIQSKAYQSMLAEDHLRDRSGE